MKYSTLILGFIILLSSCKKYDVSKFRFTTDEITETDSTGNLVGHVQPGDWEFKPISQASDFDRNVFNRVYDLSVAAGLNPNTREDTIFNFNRYNLNCTSSINLKVIAYPNPMQTVYPKVVGPIPTNNLYFKFITDLKIANYLIFPVMRIGERPGYVVYGNAGYNPDGINMDQILYGGTPTVERDFILYIIIYTTDGCVFFCKGNVIGGE